MSDLSCHRYIKVKGSADKSKAPLVEGQCGGMVVPFPPCRNK